MWAVVAGKLIDGFAKIAAAYLLRKEKQKKEYEALEKAINDVKNENIAASESTISAKLRSKWQRD